MSLFKKNDTLLDDAVGQVANEPIDPKQVEDAANRVWARLSQGAVAESPAPVMAETPAPAAGSLHGCEDFQTLIPAYLRGELSPARALLVEDHTRSCVPCRRALREAREGKVAAERRPVRKDYRKAWLAAAAVLTVVLGFGLVTLIQEMLAGGSNMASVEAVEGTLYRVAGDSSKPLAAGESIDEGEVVRTAKGSTALLRMADGSTIEMAERASFALDASRKGNTIELDRGKVIVHAAKQRDRHLFVATRDALVSVRGTIFAVNSGIKGSRVSVVEGEVRVEQNKKDAILRPGNQVTTHASVERVPVKSEIAWSRDAAEYEQLLAELTAVGRDIDARVARPGLRYSTRLLDLAPAGTTIWIGLPNLSQSLTQTQTILDEKIAESPSLAKWWADTLRSSGNEQKFRELIQKVGDLGRNLGDEIAVAINADDNHGHGEDGLVLLAEVTNEAAFRATLEAEIANINVREGKQSVVIVNDLAAAPANGDAMLLWIGNGLFVASPSIDQIRAVAAGGSGFAATTFRAKIAQQYNDGSGWLFAADLHSLIEKGQAEESEEDRQTAERLGILDVENFIIDRREIDGRAETRAALTFSQQRRGVAAWLAAPAPMGSIGFFSSDANLAAAFVVKSPVAIVDELLSLNPEFAQELEKLRSETGLDLRNDLAAPMGGEVAVGLDGPVLPSPSWKLVAEVYDPARLQQTFEKIVAHANTELRKNGKGHQLSIVTTEAGGRTYYAIRFQEAKLVELNYVFEDGYMVAAPSRALLERAIQLRESGVTLATHAKFRDLLGPDGQVNVSALVYQNLAPLAKSADKLIPDGAKRGGQEGPNIARILATQGPTLYYAYAEPDRIVFAGSNQNPLGLNLGTLAGAGGLLGMMGEAHGEAHQQQEGR
ncbi:MAG TPA: FecR domain-containing protein [Thermoanaerobaculia bacterium]|nr:FecR domain-containing protein [Thermoanaerobaculia bacterium]